MDVQVTVVEPMKMLFTRLAVFLPSFLAAIAILIIGWLVARVVKELVVKGLKVVRLDEASRRTGLEEILAKGSVGHSLSELIAIFLYWMVLLVALIGAANALNLMAVAELLDRILGYIPSVVAGVVILIIGSFFATMVGSLVQTVTANAGVKQARGLGQVARVMIIIFAIEVALEKFIGLTTLHRQLTIIVAAFAFGAALAFGLGCKDLAGRFVSDLVDKLKK